MFFKDQISDLMLQNRRQSGEFQYTVPSPDSYPYQWLWDSCFHAIILSHFNLEDAKKELRSVVSKQFKNGMIPHMIYWQKKPRNSQFPAIHWGKRYTSTLTQPPMLAYAVWQIYTKSLKQSDQSKESSIQFLREMYKPLCDFHQFFLTERDPRGNHLIAIINPDESGEDNSPRFDLPLGLSSKHRIEENFEIRKQLYAQNKICKFDAVLCMRNKFWVKDVPINAILVENLKIMSDIASALGEDEDSDYFLHQSRLINFAMQLLMSEDEIYWSTMGTQYKRIKVKTWAIFSPLFAKLLSPQDARKLVDKHLLNEKEFKTQFMVPTTSIAEESFDPNGFWRGPVWISTNWFIYQGLKKYGFLKEAKLIKEKSMQLLEKSGFREQFNPLTGEGYGARDFTWSGLVLDMN